MSDQDLYTLKPSQIVMYGVDWCPDCRRARFYFKRHSIQHVEIDVDDDKQAAAFVKQVNNGNRSVPTIIFPDGTVMVEPSEAQLNAKFN